MCGSHLWLAFYFYCTVLVQRALNNKLQSLIPWGYETLLNGLNLSAVGDLGSVQETQTKRCCRSVGAIRRAKTLEVVVNVKRPANVKG